MQFPTISNNILDLNAYHCCLNQNPGFTFLNSGEDGTVYDRRDIMERLKIYLFLLILLSAFQSFAQQKFTISGYFNACSVRKIAAMVNE
jgi:hypothetical protein